MKTNMIGNKILVILFIFLLVTPVALMNRQKGKVSEVENRTLASFPQIFDAEGHIASCEELRSGLENWWGDNLGFRAEFVKLANSIKIKLFHQSTSEKVAIGKNGWYFTRENHNIELATGEYTLSSEVLKRIAERQQRISDWYASEGVQYLLVLTPSKATIYPEYIAAGEYEVRNTVCDQVEEYLEEHTTVEVVNTKTAFLENKQLGKLFLQNDSHFTQLGAYIVYQEVSERLEKLGFSIQEFPVDFAYGRQDGGDLANLMGAADILGSETVPYAHWDQNSILVHSGTAYEALVNARLERKEHVVLLENDVAKNGTMLIYSDSQWAAERDLPQWFGENFKTVARLWKQSFDLELDETIRPDVVILGGGERLLDTSLTGTFGVPRLAYSLPELQHKEMIKETADGKWVGNYGMWLDKYNGVKPQNAGEIVIDPAAQTVTLEGWAADFGANKPFQTLYLQVGDTLFECDYGGKRADLPNAYGYDALLETGFKIMFPADYLQDGAVTEISFIGVSADGQYIYTPVTYKLLYQ